MSNIYQISDKVIDLLRSKELAEIEQYIETGDLQNDQISKRGVYWHLDHSLKVIIGICKNLTDSDPSDFKPDFKLAKTVILTLRHIPRGAGKAPKVVVTNEDITKENLLNQLNLAQEVLPAYMEANRAKFFSHPYFGHLSKKQTSRFLRIHTRHHLKIVRDIVKANG